MISLEGTWRVALQDGSGCEHGRESEMSAATGTADREREEACRSKKTHNSGPGSDRDTAEGRRPMEMRLPGTLDENGIGYRDTGSNQWQPDDNPDDAKVNLGPGAPIATRFTRKHTYEGEARFTRTIRFEEMPGTRTFLDAERARVLRLLVDGTEAPDFIPPSISTPHCFEVTGLLNGTHELTLVSDNSYPGLPHDAIVYSSAATDETQTNWNGVLGFIGLRREKETFLHAVRVYPQGDFLTIKADVASAGGFDGTLTVRSEALEKDYTVQVRIPAETEEGSAGRESDGIQGEAEDCMGDQRTEARGEEAAGRENDEIREEAGSCAEAQRTEARGEEAAGSAGRESDGTREEAGSCAEAQRTEAREEAADSAGRENDEIREEAGSCADGQEAGAGKSRRGLHEIEIGPLPLAAGVRRWDEYEGSLYTLTASLSNGAARTVRFGVRDFGDNGKGRLALNGRAIFLRSEANCAEFPEEGHPPMTVEAWRQILLMYRSYGVNCMRFHSHCPPEAAFEAADELGMLMQPELSHWDPRTAFEAEESYFYYQKELAAILHALANHPSFVMLTFGNELWAHETGVRRMHRMLRQARAIDPTRLYASASNGFYGTRGCDPESDFYTSSDFGAQMLRGTSAARKKGEGLQGYINQKYPDARTNYDGTMAELRKTFAKPVFSFEVGQYEVLPDFRELEDFHGVSEPANIDLIRQRAKEAGILDRWEQYVAATGELSRLGYREEIEAAMRTEELSGISLLGLQDFPGQGTALVGMLNSHLQPKPYPFAAPERFAEFFRSELVLAALPRYTWEDGDLLEAEITVANYGRKEICAAPVCGLYCVGRDGSREKIAGVSLAQTVCPAGGLTKAGTLRLRLSCKEQSVTLPPAGEGRAAQVSPTGERQTAQFSPTCEGQAAQVSPTCEGQTAQFPPTGEEQAAKVPPTCKKQAVRLELRMQVGSACNTWPLWVYPKIQPVCPPQVYETESFDREARETLAKGGIVYLTPPSDAEHLPHSIQAQFTTDFWSVGTFPAQEGGMGQLIDAAHPLFERFPTEFYTNWQWWPMARQRAVILPERKDSIVEEMDSYAYMRPMTQLLECRCGGGRLLLSSFGLQNLQQYPEARALLGTIYDYLASDQFAPEQELEEEILAELVPEQSWKRK